jgi:hypothetical protein
MARAEDIYSRLETGGAAALDELISGQQSEELFLDFKRSADSGAGNRLCDIDRNNLSRAISGFANSEGGVIVWGVDCRTGQGGADIPRCKVLLSDCRAFVSWLEGAVSGCTLPVCPGVISTPLSTGDGARGFAATYIPSSFLAPHQAIPEAKYFIRAGSSFVPAPHAVLSALFGKRPAPRPIHSLVVRDAEIRPHTTTLVVMVSLLLHNVGRAIARDVFATCDFVHHGQVSIDRRDPAFEYYDALDEHIAVVSRDGFKLPPTGQVAIVTLRLLFPRNQDGLRLQLSYGCADTPTAQLDLERNGLQMANLFSALGEAASADERRGIASRRLLG